MWIVAIIEILFIICVSWLWANGITNNDHDGDQGWLE